MSSADKVLKHGYELLQCQTLASAGRGHELSAIVTVMFEKDVS